MTQLSFSLVKAPSQAERLFALLKDYRPHRSDAIVAAVYGNRLSLSRVAARIWDIKKKYGVAINGWHDQKVPSLYWYQLERPEGKVQE